MGLSFHILHPGIGSLLSLLFANYMTVDSLLLSHTTQVVPSVAIYFPESFIKGGKFVSIVLFTHRGGWPQFLIRVHLS